MLVLREVSILKSAIIYIFKYIQKSPQMMTVKQEESFVKFLTYLLPRLQDLAVLKPDAFSCCCVLEIPEFFLSLECKWWFQVGLWAGCGEQPRGTTWSCRAALLPCEIMHQDFTNVWFSRASQHPGLTKAQLSLSPAVLQHFYPAIFSLLLVFEIYTVTPFSRLFCT